jgi:ferric-dicitrate binding protein FerR (iron transport regulator)
MSEGETETSSVWSRFQEAKRRAIGDGKEAEPQTLEELEAAIAEAAAAVGIPETGLPPRSTVHPSNKRKVTLWFYRVLVALFAVLVAGLIWWGQRMYGRL